ncbi:hypothetical protein RCO28_31815 [Streptomyces sp. LHD-70]|uniref:hypothetical protein n=1 Tax=Streptomyces sp. LHD-70 TaxID=3072140 RepID=UPI00280F1DC5|nr:hypothetical protein [Streptomyces sp. LHD-70]MDQ8707027.1 hypothetical protein [Streptomyces sp. LHD-70]
MAQDAWAGTSQRDVLVARWVQERLAAQDLDAPGARHPLLLLGGRGSGKSTLLAHLKWLGQHTHTAHLDLAQLDDGQRGTADVLTEVAFQLSAATPSFPGLRLPASGVLALALAVETDPGNRARAVQQIRTALDEGRAEEEESGALLTTLLETAASMAGLPPLALAGLHLVRGGRKVWGMTRAKQRLRRAINRLGAPPASPEEFLVSLNHGFRHGTSAQRAEAEDVMMRAFLADLERAYADGDGGERTLRCLVLLDDADNTLGDTFLEALDAARQARRTPDPLVVVAAARSRPQVLENREPGLVPHGAYLECWRGADDPEGAVFVPRRIGGRLDVAQLRPLDRDEVGEFAQRVVKTLPRVAVHGISRPGAWLGRVLYELTGGQPLATATALTSLATTFEPDEPVLHRIRQVFAADGRHTVAGPVLGQLLGEPSAADRRALPRAAASVSPGQAVAADVLWGSSTNLRERVAEAARDDLRTETALVDGEHVAVLPRVVRRLLLHELAREEGDERTRTWPWTYQALRLAAAGPEGTGALRDLAYCRLAEDDVPGATRLLHDAFQEVRAGTREAEDWCRALSWVQRAPRRGLHTAADAGSEYERRCAEVEPGLPEEQHPVARLLIAGQLTLHPTADPYAELWSDPLGDPLAELHGVIVEQLERLRGQLRAFRQWQTLDDRMRLYRKEPW